MSTVENSVIETKEYKAYESELEILIKQEKELHSKILDIVNKMQKLMNTYENQEENQIIPQYEFKEKKQKRTIKRETETEEDNDYDSEDSETNEQEDIISEDIEKIENDIMEDEEESEKEKPKPITKKQQKKAKEEKTEKTVKPRKITRTKKQ